MQSLVSKLPTTSNTRLFFCIHFWHRTIDNICDVYFIEVNISIQRWQFYWLTNYLHLQLNLIDMLLMTTNDKTEKRKINCCQTATMKNWSIIRKIYAKCIRCQVEFWIENPRSVPFVQMKRARGNDNNVRNWTTKSVFHSLFYVVSFLQFEITAF